MSVMILLTVGFAWPWLRFLPYKQAIQVFKFWARLIFWVGLSPIVVKGREHLTQQPTIFVANHASYIDIILLATILPGNCSIIGKKELLSVPVLHGFLKKLNFIPIDRMDIMNSEKDIQHIEQELLNGHSVIIFPEGTFSYATGIQPFKSGAFKVAATTGYPIIPIAINGARKMLRAHSYLLRPTIIKLTILPALHPTGDSWDDVVKLREITRLEIAKYSEEQTIN